MITLSPGSLCDVCAEEYGPHNYPHSISCGHVLCANCCSTIIEKTSPRLSPVCPFCRINFTSDSVRLIRVDFGSSGWSTPMRGALEANDVTHPVLREDEEELMSSLNRTKTRRLESKVARVAAKKCSVEEVSSLHKEIQELLATETNLKPQLQLSSLHLSAALLRAILLNHVAHTEATKTAKATEMQLRYDAEKVEHAKNRLEIELHSLRGQYTQKAQECQSLHAELNRMKIRSGAGSLGIPAIPQPATATSHNSALTSPPRPQSTSVMSRPGATSPTSPSRTYTPAVSSRLGSQMHARSTSMQPALNRPFTPSVRSGTPATSPEPPATRMRRMSLSTPTSTPPKISRSSSDEKEKEKQKEKDARRVQLIQRWIPGMDQRPQTAKPDRYHSQTPVAVPAPSRTMLAASTGLHPPTRFKTPFSAT